MNLRPGIEIDDAFLVALAEDDTFTLVEVDVLTVELHKLTHTHTGGSQQVDDGEITDFGAAVTELFDVLIAQHLLDLRTRLDLVYPADRAFHNVIFFFKPGEERREYPDILFFLRLA